MHPPPPPHPLFYLIIVQVPLPALGSLQSSGALTLVLSQLLARGGYGESSYVVSPLTFPAYTLSPLSQVPVDWLLDRFMKASADVLVGSFRRTLWGKVFRPD